jgi:predicted MPP superfamily phosphohydrolase
VIGPLVRSPRRVPRSSPLLPSGGRRFENLAIHWVERLTAPLAFWRHKRLVVEQRDVAIDGLAPAFDGYRIAFLADFHYSAVVPDWWVVGAVSTAMELRPDLILLGGDYVSHSVRYAPSLAALLRPLAARDGVFAVLGNHDHYVGADLVRAALRDAGVVELRNASVLVERGEARLAVAGVGDLQYDVIDFRAALAGVSWDTPRIVLSHHPDVFAHWPAELRLDLMLAGHTHGGQAHLPLLGPPYVPSQFGLRYLAGHFREGGRQLYVTRGVGVITAPFRWKCPPEATLLVLHPLDRIPR